MGKIAHELGRSVTDVTTKAKQLKDSVTCSPGMVRLSDLRPTAQNPRPPKSTAALPDDLITQREEPAAEEAEEQGEAEEQEAEVPESRPRRRRPRAAARAGGEGPSQEAEGLRFVRTDGVQR